MIFRERTNRRLLEELCEHLQAGESIPSELAESCAEIISAALKKGGRLKFGGKPGPEKDVFAKADIASLVAQRMLISRREGRKGGLRDEAAEHVANATGKTFDTVLKYYKKYGKYGRSSARFYAQKPRVIELMQELEKLLLTFTASNGSSLLTRDQAHKAAGHVPIPYLPTCVDAIQNGPFRRDLILFEEIFSPVREAGYQILRI